MIQKIIDLKNVGLFRKVAAVDFSSVTLIYGENGRGKSTLADVLRACTSHDTAALHARHTIDQDDDTPTLKLLVQTDDNTDTVSYDGTAWQGNLLSMQVFDSIFVEKNVYSGFSVSSEQRKGLLGFALGENLSNINRQIDELSVAIKQAGQNVKTYERELLGLISAHFQTKDFIALSPDDDIQTKIAEQRRHLVNAQNKEDIRNRPKPVLLDELTLDTERIVRLLQKQLEDVEQDAEKHVREHLVAQKHGKLEAWLAKGQTFLPADNCPFCGQPLEGVQLIQAYQGYFNRAYRELKSDIDDLYENLKQAVSTQELATRVKMEQANSERISSWQKELQVMPAPVLAQATLKSMLTRMYTTLLELVGQKQRAPLEVPDQLMQKMAEVDTYLSDFNGIIQTYNQEVVKVQEAMRRYVSSLEAEDVSEIEAQLRVFELTAKRFEPDIIQLCNDFEGAEQEKKQLEKDKKQLRQQLDEGMTSLLTRYRAKINALLQDLGAEFSLGNLTTAHQGGAPRSKYDLNIRDKAIRIAPEADFASPHTFANTLSEADKRTLALAFFFARLQDDPTLHQSIVLLDDPVSSMDRNRRTSTIQRIVALAKECQQLIVTSHDAYFVKDLRDEMNKKLASGNHAVKVLHIKRGAGSYSVFTEGDIDAECQSPYQHHYQMLRAFVESDTQYDLKVVAKAVRPLLEGYLHRRFVGVLPNNHMLGQIIAQYIETDDHPELASLKEELEVLRAINNYAGQFHHDTNPDGADSVRVVDAELLKFSKQALNFVLGHACY